MSRTQERIRLPTKLRLRPLPTGSPVSDRYAELTYCRCSTRAVKDVARGTRIAHALGISHSELVDVVDDEAGRNKLALRFRGRPDSVAAALSDDADAREVGPRKSARAWLML